MKEQIDFYQQNGHAIVFHYPRLERGAITCIRSFRSTNTNSRSKKNATV